MSTAAIDEGSDHAQQAQAGLPESPILDIQVTAVPRRAKAMVRLQGRWQPGAFIWAAVWQPAYSVEKYWWLYGHLAA